MQALLVVARREIAIHMARKGEWITVLLFYVLCASLFPIAIGSWPRESLSLAPVIMWVAALMAIMLAQESLLREDFRLGAFDLIFLHPLPTSLILLIKILVHWLVFAMPIVLVTPFVAISFGLSAQSIIAITASLFIGTLFLSFMAAIGAALTVPLARGGTFVALLILPLYMPALCIGASIGVLSVNGYISVAHFALLTALAIIAVIVAPILVAIAIKVSLE